MCNQLRSQLFETLQLCWSAKNNGNTNVSMYTDVTCELNMFVWAISNINYLENIPKFVKYTEWAVKFATYCQDCKTIF